MINFLALARYLKNLRPITLLYTDYKLIEKVIAARIKPVLGNLIHLDQKGFLPKRQKEQCKRGIEM